MLCPRCGMEMAVLKTLQRAALTVRMRVCQNKRCADSFVTEEGPGDPKLYRRLLREDKATPPQPQASVSNVCVCGEFKRLYVPFCTSCLNGLPAGLRWAVQHPQRPEFAADVERAKEFLRKRVWPYTRPRKLQKA